MFVNYPLSRLRTLCENDPLASLVHLSDLCVLVPAFKGDTRKKTQKYSWDI